MPKRTASAKEEPEQMSFELPSEKEHLWQVVDLFDQGTEGNKFNLDADTVLVKFEVVGGDEEGRSILQRLSLDDKWKGFFATRLFLKAISEPYKGDEFAIDTDNWVGKQFYATVKHSEYKGKTYANIDEYNYDKLIKQENVTVTSGDTHEEELAWDE